MFLEDELGQRKRFLSNQEDHVNKYIRVESERAEVRRLVVHQEAATRHAKRALEEAQQLYEEEKRNTGLLHDYELNLTFLQGEIAAEMTDEDIVGVHGLSDRWNGPD